MKIRGVRINNRRKAFEVRTSSRRMLLPFAKVAPKPTPTDPVVQVFVDKEIGSEGFGPRTSNRSSSTTRIPITSAISSCTSSRSRSRNDSRPAR